MIQRFFSCVQIKSKRCRYENPEKNPYGKIVVAAAAEAEAADAAEAKVADAAEAKAADAKAVAIARNSTLT